MRNEAGFTLLELLVALVVTGLVTTLAYAVASTGFDTSDRIERYRTTIETHAIVRALLLDALRHPPAQGGAAMNEVLLAIDDMPGSNGLPGDRIRFLSRGVTSPLGASDQWAVTVGPSNEGVRIVATPQNGQVTSIEMVLLNAHGLEVRALDRTTDSVWVDQWQITGRVPAAVSMTFLLEGGAQAAPTLVVHSGLESIQ